MVLGEAVACLSHTLNPPVKDNSQVEVVGHAMGRLVVRDLWRWWRQCALPGCQFTFPTGKGGKTKVIEQYSFNAVMPRLHRGDRPSFSPARANGREGLDSPEVDRGWAMELLRRAGLQPKTVERVLMYLVHEPLLYHGLRRCRRTLGRIKGIRIE
jgi:hypothetical protein